MTLEEGLAQLTREDFADCVEETCAMRHGAAEISLRLIEASGLGAGEDGRRDPFSLVFLGPPTPRLSQGIHPLEHARLGRLEIFLVPVGANEDGTRYEAVFS